MNFGISGNSRPGNRVLIYISSLKNWNKKYCFQLVTMVTEKQNSKQLRFLTLQENLCNKRLQVAFTHARVRRFYGPVASENSAAI